jgi:HEAT repeat protein
MLPASNTRDIHSRLASSDPEVRRIAVMNLPDNEEEDIETLLLAALQDTDAKVRTEAARLLEGFETHPVVAGLVGALEDSDHDVCEAAATSLSELKEPPMGDGLLAALTETRTPFVKAALFRALRELRRAETFSPALAALQESTAEVRCAALGVLGYLKNGAALAEIARIAGADVDPEARRIAVGALGFATDGGGMPQR